MKNSGCRISAYVPCDEQALFEFFRAVFADLGFTFDLLNKDADLSRIPEVYQTNGGIFLLARHGGCIVGSVATRKIAQGTGEVKRFYVRKEHRHHGVGTLLLSRALDHARAQPWVSIRLDTSSQLTAATSLFRKHGFKEISRYNADPFADVFMELKLR
jgi:putative acetyltransferase